MRLKNVMMDYPMKFLQLKVLPGGKLVNMLVGYAPFKPVHSNSFYALGCPFYCCCDGLCFIGIWSDLDESEQPPILLLWNPSTRESLKLPTRYPESPPEKYLYGLGYDSTSHDYKITRIDAFEECDDGIPDEILAIKSASRRKTSDCAGGIRAIQTRLRELCLAFVEGAFYWEGINTCCVVSFNISNETYEKMPLPVTPYTNSGRKTLLSS
ncbi:hypothetical protein CQW23_00684 [Capsicum baccatum]|uniref:F-box associated beta-propeller type 1 domain-containing protein n=1 Tax=Capsicum baccatum TaxID=33114 RepID=A0A2G2XLT5_CAPBA|nr:hypothetical protein CQW23_00684 [Capsicum baccatum]